MKFIRELVERIRAGRPSHDEQKPPDTIYASKSAFHQYPHDFPEWWYQNSPLIYICRVCKSMCYYVRANTTCDQCTRAQIP